MPKSRDMLVGCHLNAELLTTRLAIEGWGPMIQIVHILIASALSTESTSARFAFGPVVIVFHVLAFLVECGRTGLALIFGHLAQRV